MLQPVQRAPETGLCLTAAAGACTPLYLATHIFKRPIRMSHPAQLDILEERARLPKEIAIAIAPRKEIAQSKLELHMETALIYNGTVGRKVKQCVAPSFLICCHKTQKKI